MSYITAIGTSTPANRIAQVDIARFMSSKMQLDPSQRRKLNVVFRSSGIDYRYSVLDDYGKTSGYSFYPNQEGEHLPDIEKRMALFRTHALPLSVAAVRNLFGSVSEVELSSVTHLIVVTCTGMYAPGLDIDLIKSLKLSSSISRTSITFMGCYAAFNALKAAKAFCSEDESARVLIVCTELCSIHFQHTGSDDNLLANALFGDGSAAMLVEARPSGKRNLEMKSFANELAFEGEADMAWNIGNTGFEMKLSSYVPGLIGKDIRAVMQALLDKLGITRRDIRFFAIHPGGKRILEAIEQQLELTSTDNAAAYEVLKNYGNMSSPTVVFVLNELFKKLTRDDDGSRILSFAFGPGLTLEGMVLQAHLS